MADHQATAEGVCGQAACRTCGKTIHRNGSRGRLPHHCDECRPAARKESARLYNAARTKQEPETWPLTCAFCLKPFQAADRKQRCCSHSCAGKDRAAKWGQRVNTERICQHCGKRYLPKSASRVTFCSRECGIDARLEQGKKSRAVEEEARRAKRLKRCRNCSQQFTAKYPWVEYCSGACRREKHNLAVKGQYKPRPTVTFSCIVCGVTTTGQSGPRCRKYCSKVCSKRAENRKRSASLNAARRLRKAVVSAGENVNPYEVFARDGWICQLCGKKVKRNATTPDPKAPVLDHIVPITKGGEHTYRNVQCAHFLCNSRRREVGSAQMRLFG